jgi:hypothetical protein
MRAATRKTTRGPEAGTSPQEVHFGGPGCERGVNYVDVTTTEETAIEIVQVEDEVAPELTLYADWLTYEVVPGGPGNDS